MIKSKKGKVGLVIGIILASVFLVLVGYLWFIGDGSLTKGIVKLMDQYQNDALKDLNKPKNYDKVVEQELIDTVDVAKEIKKAIEKDYGSQKNCLTKYQIFVDKASYDKKVYNFGDNFDILLQQQNDDIMISVIKEKGGMPEWVEVIKNKKLCFVGGDRLPEGFVARFIGKHYKPENEKTYFRNADKITIDDHNFDVVYDMKKTVNNLYRYDYGLMLVVDNQNICLVSVENDDSESECVDGDDVTRDCFFCLRAGLDSGYNEDKLSPQNLLDWTKFECDKKIKKTDNSNYCS